MAGSLGDLAALATRDTQLSPTNESAAAVEQLYAGWQSGSATGVSKKNMAHDRIIAEYLVETPLSLAAAAESMAGEQSTGTFTRVPR